jgi:putative transposase
VKSNPVNKHRRRSIRLKGYDYTQPGAYFVTIVTHARACLFGEIVDGKVWLNDAGISVQVAWHDLQAHYLYIKTDAFVVMPNHIHGVIVLVGAGPGACPPSYPEPRQPQGVAPTLSLPEVVHRFKTLTTKHYIDKVKKSGWTPFAGRLWQRNYFEHIVRGEESLNRIRQYILDNPARWEFDRENPAVVNPEGKDAWHD